MKILLIEDDKQMASSLKEAIKGYYLVDIAYTGEEGEYLVQVNEYDLVILDLMLPDMNGVEICRKIREEGVKTPVLVLTGKLQTRDKVEALDLGADDYLTKPFNFAELLARIRALLRRSPETFFSNKLSVSGLTLDVVANKVDYQGEEICLRRKCFRLLEYLMRNQGRVMTRPMILEHVWESSVDPITNTVDVHIKVLRDKVDKPFGSSLIKTVYGLGYKIEG